MKKGGQWQICEVEPAARLKLMQDLLEQFLRRKPAPLLTTVCDLLEL